MTVPALLPLFRELNDLKRIRVADKNGSIAERLFLRSWARLVSGEPPVEVALQETAHAVAAARLAGIDASVLTAGGFAAEARLSVLGSGLDVVAGPLDVRLVADLRGALRADPLPSPSAVPPFAALSARR